MAEGNYSLADIGAMMGNRTGYGDGMGFGGGYAWWIIILFFALWGNNGWGNRNGNAATTEDVYQGLADNRIMGKLDGINNGLCDGFYAQNTNLLNSQNQMSRDLCSGFAATNSAIAENRFAAEKCCCETQKELMNNRFASEQCCCTTNRNIDSVRYENSRNTCDIVRAIEKDGEATRALITANVTQALRDKIADQDRMLQTVNFQLSQQAQNAYLIGTLQPTPKPAYLTCSPYESAYTASHGYARSNCGCGCGCGGF